MRAERPAYAARRRRTAPRTRILCYHSVGTPLWGVNDVAPRRFAEQIRTATKLGFSFVPLSIALAEPDVPGRLALTFDDGLRSTAAVAGPLLAELGIPWSLFVVTGWASGRHPDGHAHLLNWDEVGALAAQGVEVGSHSVSHPDFGRLGAGQATDELGASRAELTARLGSHSSVFAVPMGGATNWSAATQRAATEAGYTAVLAQAEDRRPPGTVGRSFVSRDDAPWVFRAMLSGAFDRWQEWF